MFLVILSQKTCKYYSLFIYNSRRMPSALGKRGIFFGGDSHRLRKRFQEIAVISKAAQTAGLRDGMPLRQQDLRVGNAFRSDVAVDGGAGGLLKYLVQIGIAQIKL